MNINRDPETIMAAWLDDGPAELPAETRQAITVAIRTVPRRRAGISWPFSGGRLVRPTFDLRQVVLAMGAVAVLAVVGAVVISSLQQQVFTPAAKLPTSPADWSRLVIDSELAGNVESLSATPRGLLAKVGGDDEPRWYFSVDARTWTRVAADQIPDLSNPAFATSFVTVAGDRQRILMVGREVLSSEDGINWSVIASPSDDPELAEGAINAVAAGGPGFVAVGINNKAWYSTDGSDWTLAAVPPRPEQPAGLEGRLNLNETQGSVEMEGLAVSHNNLLAWGKSIWVHSDGSATFVPVFWTSSDGLSWTSAPAPGGAVWGYPIVTGGPKGFVVLNENGSVWLSADGRSWERVVGDAQRWSSMAGGPAGYVAASTEGACELLGCSADEAVITTSPDGHDWTRLPSDELFGGNSDASAGANTVTAWADRFVVGGSFENQPAVWVSSSAPPDNNDNSSPVPTGIPNPTAAPTGDLGIFQPVAGRIVYGSENGIYGIEDGIWGLDPNSSDPATTVQLTSEPATPLEWSADGTRLLIHRGSGNLFVLKADGSETQVVEHALSLEGATISPDGSRVVFADQSASSDCEDGVLLAVDADGGPAELLLKSPRNKKIQHPTFSPDGTQIAFTDGNCDSDHIVWVVNSDGTGAHEILTGDNQIGLGATHVEGLTWSPAGDRIALMIDCYLAVDGGPCQQALYTFAPDGSDIKRLATPGFNWSPKPYWSPDGSRIVYTTGCGFQDANDLAHECTFVIRDPEAASFDVHLFNYGIPGPWHPGTPSPSVEPSVAPSPAEEPTAVVAPSEAGTPLGWSSDGSRLLIQKGDGNLSVLHADGSETRVTEQLSAYSDIGGSALPSGATISPDGTRVVFAGLTTTPQEAVFCHDGALFAVDADGGPAELLWESQIPQNGWISYPTFSPDGSQIAFADGYCDSGHTVWVMNADSSDAHQIVSDSFGAGHVRGLAWSPTGDRIALSFDELIASAYSFAPDGSDFTRVTDVAQFCWSGRRC